MPRSEIWAAAGPAATAAAARARASTRTSFMVCAPFEQGALRRSPALYPKVLVQLVHAGGQRRVGNHVHHPPVLHDVMAVGHGGRGVKGLLDEPDGGAVLLEAGGGGAGLLGG